MVRDRSGDPVVIRNAPFLRDGTPMPTRYWLVGADLRLAVDRLEALGGVSAAEAAVDPHELAEAHLRYAAERDAEIPPDRAGPRPTGGVGGTRRGVKCLHAHFAWYLAGGDDPVGRWVEERLGATVRAGLQQDPQAGDQMTAGAVQHPVAAVDCGTNSVRLLVAAPDGKTLSRLMRITRLGAGVDRRRNLDPGAIARTVSVLKDYKAVMEGFGVERVRMTATSAARDAANRDEFFAAAADVVGVPPELLSGQEEGELSFAGATAELEGGGPYLVADIGGGSTELAVGSAGRPPTAVCSLDIGCVRVTERWLGEDPPTAAQLGEARKALGDLFDGVAGDFKAEVLVGLAGTVAALAAIDQGLDTYDRDRVHHYLLTRHRVDAILGELAGVPSSQRKQRPGVEAERADVIVGGALVLSTLMEHLGFGSCLTSEADILDGLVMTLLR